MQPPSSIPDSGALPANPSAPAGRIPALDGVRGVAILGVMLCHFTRTGLPGSVVGTILDRLFVAGCSGVDLFFVLSGFLITGILYDAKADPHFFRNFYARRVLRIFPLYYGFLFVYFQVLPRLHPFTPAMQRMAEHQPWLWGYASNLLMARTGHWAFVVDWMDLGHFWTLAIEEQFYLAWPLVVFLLPRRALLRTCVACMAGALLLRWGLLLRHASPVTVELFTLCRIDALAAGGLAALLVRGVRTGWRRHLGAMAVALGTAVAAIALARGQWSDSDPVIQRLGLSLLALFCAALVLLAAEDVPGPVARWFARPALQWFGTYSYAMYVFHVAMIPLFTRLLPVPRLATALGSAYAAVAAFAAFSIAGTALAAWLSWHLYEKHFLKLKRYFAARPVIRAATHTGVARALEGASTSVRSA